jgi:hypothetical protein
MKKPVHTILLLDTPEGLYEAALMRLKAARIRAARLHALLCATLAGVSTLCIVPLVQYTLAQLYASGFYEYLSLMLSDRTLFLTYWREFSLSLIESLPSIALIVLIPLAVAFVWSLRRLLQDVRAGFTFA